MKQIHLVTIPPIIVHQWIYILVFLLLFLCVTPCSADEKSKQQAILKLKQNGVAWWVDQGKQFVVIGDANRWPFAVDPKTLTGLKYLGPIEALYVEYSGGFQPSEYQFLEDIQSVRYMTIGMHGGEAGVMATFLSKCKGLEQLKLLIPELSPSDLAALGQSESLTKVTLTCRQFSPEHIIAMADHFRFVTTIRLHSTIHHISSVQDVRALGSLPRLKHLIIDNCNLSPDERRQLIDEFPDRKLQFLGE